MEVFYVILGEFPAYVSVAEKKAKAARNWNSSKRKNPTLTPSFFREALLPVPGGVRPGTPDLERYADYSNKIGRVAVMSVMGRLWICR